MAAGMPLAFWFLITTATACSLHDLARTCRPLDAPNEECCSLYGSLDEGDWCAADVRSSSGFAALNNETEYAAYALARACGSPLPACFVDVDREATAVKLTVLIDWQEPYASDSARWDAEITAICSPAIEYWQPHIGAYLGRDEFVEYAYTLSPAPCGNQTFNPTSTCAYATVSTRALRPCFENSTRAIDSSKNQPNRRRFGRAREV